MEENMLNCNTGNRRKGWDRDLLMLVLCSLVVLVVIVFAIVAKDLVYSMKIIRLITAPLLAIVLGIAIWQGARFVPTSNPNEGSFRKMSGWMVLGIIVIVLILVYLGTFSSDLSFDF